MTENTAQQPELTNVQPREEVAITIQDLDLASRIIGAAIERGAIKAPESEDVGRIWKKLTAFVQQAAQAAEKQQATDSPDETQRPSVTALGE